MTFPSDFAAIIISLLAVLSASLLVGAAVGILIINRFYPDLRFIWRFAFLCASISWIFSLISGYGMPIFMQSPSAGGEVLLEIRPAFIIDETSWPIAIALLTLTVAILVKELADIQQGSPVIWSGMLVMTAAGLAAIYAATPLTLMLGWAAIDLIGSAVMLIQINAAELRRQFLLAVGIRTLSICVLLWISAVFQAEGYDLTMLDYVPEMNIYLLAAAVFRLGIYPLHDPFITEHNIRRGLGTLNRLTNAAVALMLICRLAGSEIPADLFPWLLVVAAIAAFLGAISWFRASDEIDGRVSWIFTLAALSIASALLSLSMASITWTLVLMFAGSILFVTERRSRLAMALSLIGLVLCTGFPFTPTWPGMELFLFDTHTGLTNIASIVMLMLALVISLAGYFRHARQYRVVENNIGLRKEIVENLAVLFLLSVYTGLGVWNSLNVAQQAWIPSVIIAAGTIILISIRNRLFSVKRKNISNVIESKTIPVEENALILAVQPRSVNRIKKMMSSLEVVVSLDWLYIFLFRIFDFFRRLFRMMTRILEGEGGLLWALIIFILLITFMFRPSGGA